MDKKGDFEIYISKLKEDTKTLPREDLERGFRAAVIMIHSAYERMKDNNNN